MSTTTTPKWWLDSQTVRGILTLLASGLTLLGLQVTNTDVEPFVALIAAVGVVVGTIDGIIGRKKADQPLGFSRKSK